MANVLLKRSSLDTDRIPSEHEGRIWDDVSVNQRILINHQDLGEQHGTHFFLTAFRTNQLCQRLVLPSRIVKQYIAVESRHPICGALLGNP